MKENKENKNNVQPVPITHTKDSLEISLQFTQFRKMYTDIITSKYNPNVIHYIISSNVIVFHRLQITRHLKPYFLWRNTG